MTVELEKFDAFTQEFLTLSSTLGDEWVMKMIDSGKKDYYLEKRCILNEGCSDSDCVNENIEFLQNSFSVFVYHIVYSQSYSVPVLYFNAYHENGKLFSLDEIWNKIPNCYQDCVETNKWHMITQQEHPKLGIPYFMIHPCYTAELMSSCNTSNYIITWLSIVGPLVGIQLSCEYARYTKVHKEKNK